MNKMWMLIVIDENGEERMREFCRDKKHLEGTAHYYKTIRPDFQFIVTEYK